MRKIIAIILLNRKGYFSGSCRSLRIISILLILTLSFFYACKGKEESAKTLIIYTLKGPSGVGMVRLLEELPQIKVFDVRVEVLANADLMAARFISGEAKVGILPANMAAKIASSGRGVQAAATIGMGMLSLLSSDPDARSIKDLRGKRVEVAGQGATPDHLFRRILRGYDLEPGTDVTFGYSLTYPEIAQSLVAGRVSIALLPEPFTTMALLNKPDLKQIADIQAEWVAACGTGNYPMTLLVVDGEFALVNTDAIGKISDAIKSSIEWVIAHPVEAGALAEKHGLGIKADVVAAAVPKSNYKFIPAVEARSSIEELFKIFLENDPASIGGSLPDNEFYWQAK